MAFGRKKKKNVSSEEAMYMETQWQLIVRKFKKHKLAMVGLMEKNRKKIRKHGKSIMWMTRV